MRHIISALVQNEPGVLAHIAGMFAARGFNIDSLVVGETEKPELSRMTLVVRGDDCLWRRVRVDVSFVGGHLSNRNCLPPAGRAHLPYATSLIPNRQAGGNHAGLDGEDGSQPAGSHTPIEVGRIAAAGSIAYSGWGRGAAPGPRLIPACNPLAVRRPPL